MALVEEAAVITTTQEALDSGMTDLEAAQKYGEDVVLEVKNEIMNEKEKPELLVGDTEDIASESRLDEEADLNDSIDAEHLAEIVDETSE